MIDYSWPPVSTDSASVNSINHGSKIFGKKIPGSAKKQNLNLLMCWQLFTQHLHRRLCPVTCQYCAFCIRDLILVCEPGPGTNPPWILRDSCNCKIATRYFQILSIRMPQDIIFFWNGCISMCHPIRSSAVWPCHSLSSSGVYLFIPLNWGGPCNCSD